MSEKKYPSPSRYTEEELMVRLKFFIGICLALTLIGIVFVVLYSIIFVTQPLNAISPIDSKFFELIIPVATFLCGTLSGIMLAGTGKDAMMGGVAMANKANGVGTPPAAPLAPPAVQKPLFSASTTVGGTTLSMDIPPPPVRLEPTMPPPPPPPPMAVVSEPPPPPPPPPGAIPKPPGVE